MKRLEHRLLLGALGAILVLTVLLTVMWFEIGDTNARLRQDEARARQNVVFRLELNECHRLNIVRAEQNRQALAIWLGNEVQAQVIVASIKQRTASVHRSPAQQRAAQQFVGAYYTIANSARWIPLTDCHAAIYNSDYRAPGARRMPIPQGMVAAATTLGPNN